VRKGESRFWSATLLQITFGLCHQRETPVERAIPPLSPIRRCRKEEEEKSLQPAIITKGRRPRRMIGGEKQR
jgi:hypothetical protein